MIIFLTPSLGFFNTKWHDDRGQILARDHIPGNPNYPYIYDLQPNGSWIKFGDAWENFKRKDDEILQMPEFARALIPIAIFVAHILTASFIINRIGSKFNQNHNSIFNIMENWNHKLS